MLWKVLVVKLGEVLQLLFRKIFTKIQDEGCRCDSVKNVHPSALGQLGEVVNQVLFVGKHHMQLELIDNLLVHRSLLQKHIAIASLVLLPLQVYEHRI